MSRLTDEWVRYNYLTDTYDTRDETTISAMLVDGVQCLSDVLHIAAIREEQRNRKNEK
jgi:hypothetical protein